MADDTQMFVVPVSGMKVKDPASHQALPDGGAFVPRNQFWLRRLSDGDVTEGKPPSESTTRTSARGSRE